MSEVKPVKPGWKSTEAIAALVGNAVGIATITGVLSPAQAGVIGDSTPIIMGAIITLITNVGYIFGRSWIKK